MLNIRVLGWLVRLRVANSYTQGPINKSNLVLVGFGMELVEPGKYVCTYVLVWIVEWKLLRKSSRTVDRSRLGFANQNEFLLFQCMWNPISPLFNVMYILYVTSNATDECQSIMSCKLIVFADGVSQPWPSSWTRCFCFHWMIFCSKLRHHRADNELSVWVSGITGSQWGLPGWSLRGHQLVRHPRQESDHHAQGHPARQKNSRREGITPDCMDPREYCLLACCSFVIPNIV